MTKEFEFTIKEIRVLEATAGVLIANDINRIKNRVDAMFKRMKSFGVDPEKRLAEIATQEKYDPKTMSLGDCMFYTSGYQSSYTLNYNYDGFNRFGGGFKKDVFGNMLEKFGFCPYSGYMNSSWLLPCLTINRAMWEDRQVDLFVRSVISATEKICTYWSEWEKLICDTIKSFFN